MENKELHEVQLQQSIGLWCGDYGFQSSVESIKKYRQLYDENRSVQEAFEQATHCMSTDMVNYVFQATGSELLALPEAYPVVFLLQAAYIDYKRDNNTQYSLAGGTGIGIFAALYAAQSLQFFDGLYILAKWGSLLQALLEPANYKKIYCSGIQKEDVRIAMQHIVQKTGNQLHIVAMIAPTVLYIVGVRSAVDELQEALSAAFPDSDLYEVAPESGLYCDIFPEEKNTFEQVLVKIEFQDPIFPITIPWIQEPLTTAAQVKLCVAQFFFSQQRVDGAVQAFVDSAKTLQHVDMLGVEPALTTIITEQLPHVMCIEQLIVADRA